MHRRQSMVCQMVIGGAMALSLGRAAEPAITLTEATQIRRLSVDEAGQGYPVDVTGVVTFSAPSRGLLFVQDTTGGIFVSPQTTVWDWRVGQRVQITGVAAQGSHLPFINQAVLRDLGPGILPVARPVTFTQLATNTEDGNWVEVQGVVRTAMLKENRLFLELVAEGRRLQAVFADPSDNPDDLEVLIDAEVRVQGVCGVVNRDTNSPIFIDLHVPSYTNLTANLVSPELSSPTSLISVSRLNTLPLDAALLHRVRVKGTLNHEPDGRWRLTDPTGSTWIQTRQVLPAMTNTLAEALGFPRRQADTSLLEDAVIHYLELNWPETPPGLTNVTREYLAVLTRVQDIRRLPPSQAQRGYPVRMRAVVTYTDPHWRLLFVHDGSFGIQVLEDPFAFAGQLGQLVEVTGYTGSGQFAPLIRQPHIQILGEGTLPRAQTVTLDQLLSGSEDSQRVQITGIGRSLGVEDRHLRIHINASGGLLWAFVPNIDTNRNAFPLLDAEIEVTGVCGSRFNKQRQLTGIQLHVARLEDIRITKPAPADPFSLPVQPIRHLLQFQPRSEFRHRVHVRGIVTYRDPQWYTLFIQDETGGLFIRTLQQPTLAVGDQVDVAGFVIPETMGPSMSEATFKRIGPGQPPQPIVVTGAEAASGDYDARLVTLEARLVDRIPDTSGRGLVLQAEEWSLKALLENSQDAQALQAIRPGSRLRVTGVCSFAQNEDELAGRNLRLCLRSVSDVRVLSQPPWWTPRHWLVLLASLLIILGVTSAWVLMLRRNVHKQTDIIRKRLENEAALEARYRDLFENVNDLIQSFHPNGALMFVNPAWRRTLGYTVEEAAKLSFADVIHPEDASQGIRLWERLLAGEQLSHVQIRFRGKDGRVIETEGSCSASFHDGKPTAIRGIFRDVSELKQLEAQFLQAQKMEAIGQLAGGVAHDFNNILASIMLNLGLLKTRPDLAAEVIEGLEELEHDAQRATNLTRQLLLFGRRQAMEPKRLDLQEVLAGLMKMLSRILGEHIVIDISEPKEAMWVNADAGMLEQLLVNLCVNARDAMPNGGRLTLATRSVTYKAGEIPPQSEAREGRFVRLSVADTGMGMDDATRNRVFEPFFTTKEIGKGTGLGLATAYGIAKSHKGWVEVESTVGVGSTFHVFLPAIDPPKSSPPPNANLVVRGGHETILLVEDDESLRRVARLTLTRHGYEVLEARNGVEALQLWQTHQRQIALLLTDMIMPKGLNGLELAEKLLHANSSLKAVISSGYSLDLARRDPSQHPQIKYIAKPYTPAALAQIIRECLDAKPDR